jgi:hypothetical protein
MAHRLTFSSHHINLSTDLTKTVLQMKVLYFWVEVGRGSGNGVEKIILTFIT